MGLKSSYQIWTRFQFWAIAIFVNVLTKHVVFKDITTWKQRLGSAFIIFLILFAWQPSWTKVDLKDPDSPFDFPDVLLALAINALVGNYL
tara:strand:- start:7855 stop:8124 length:270 start_codon:yes stop_codon:yes gene_type:complete